MELDDGKLKVHLIVFEDLQSIQLIKSFKNTLNVLRNWDSTNVRSIHIYLGPLENFPEIHYTLRKSLNVQIEFFVQLVHFDEIITIEITLLLIEGCVHIDFMDFCNFPQQILLINYMTALIEFSQSELIETAHLKYAKHLFSLVK